MGFINKSDSFKLIDIIVLELFLCCISYFLSPYFLFLFSPLLCFLLDNSHFLVLKFVHFLSIQGEALFSKMHICVCLFFHIQLFVKIYLFPLNKPFLIFLRFYSLYPTTSHHIGFTYHFSQGLLGIYLSRGGGVFVIFF